MTADPLIGKRFGHYLILEKLGEGAMGAVYKAQQTNLQRPVALKLLPPAYKNNQSLLERFQREAMAAARLEDRHIVQVYDVLREGGETFIVMQYVEGNSVEQILRERGRLSVVKAVTITLAVLKGLARAHAKGILHRDIKPGNILLSKEREVKLADFGLARFAGEQASMTHPGQVMGTPFYMSPEQCMGDRPIDQRSDLYAVGVTLYEMLTGKVPFHGSSAYVVMRQHVDEDLPDPDSADNPVPPEISTIVRRLTARDLAERYPSAEAAIADLDRWRKCQPQEDTVGLTGTRRRQKTGMMTKALRRSEGEPPTAEVATPGLEPTPSPPDARTFPLITPPARPAPGLEEFATAAAPPVPALDAPAPATAAEESLPLAAARRGDTARRVRAREGTASGRDAAPRAPAPSRRLLVLGFAGAGLCAGALLWFLVFRGEDPNAKPIVRGPTTPALPALPAADPAKKQIADLVAQARTLLEVDQAADAVNVLKTVLGLDPSNREIAELLRAACDRAAVLEKKASAEHFLKIGREELIKEQWDRALRAFEDAAGHMDLPEARLGRAEATARKLEAAGDLDGAVDVAQRALSSDTGRGGPAEQSLSRELERIARRRTDQSKTQSVKQELEDLLRRGETAERGKRWAEAVAAYGEALKLLPEAGRAPVAVAAERCAAALAKEQKLDADVEALVAGSAKARLGGDMANAWALINRAALLRPLDPRVVAELKALQEHKSTGLALARDCRAKGDWPRAYEIARNVRRADPTHEEAFAILKEAAGHLLPDGCRGVGNVPADPDSGFPTRILARDDSLMALVPGGKSPMGSDSDRPDERPEHEVELSDYYIDVAEVTVERYGKYLQATRHRDGTPPCFAGEPEGEDHGPMLWSNPRFNAAEQPVAGVDWMDAMGYAAWTGRRLPTEAEWEKAAAWDPMHKRYWRYPWCGEWDRTRCNSACYWAGKELETMQAVRAFWDAEASRGGSQAKTLPPGTFSGSASFYGCRDLAGNLWEWCLDWYEPDYYKKSPTKDPRGPERGAARVLRGGSWHEGGPWLRTGLRTFAEPKSGGEYLQYAGFRCVLPLWEGSKGK
ncbi:MAG: SUMF1/EgtB/PvdO family nonheme iron enzyme [Planctomycetes bacterium]|nr:SUMF1/EgtB/PvdO family nonheme iron enzyme [Planctomycetota bacterium]